MVLLPRSLSWITYRDGSQHPGHEDTQAALWRSPCREKLRLLNSSPLEANLIATVKTSNDYNLSSHLDCNFTRDLGPLLPNHTISESLTHRNCKIMNVYCYFILLSFPQKFRNCKIINVYCCFMLPCFRSFVSQQQITNESVIVLLRLHFLKYCKKLERKLKGNTVTVAFLIPLCLQSRITETTMRIV